MEVTSSSFLHVSVVVDNRTAKVFLVDLFVHSAINVARKSMVFVFMVLVPCFARRAVVFAAWHLGAIMCKLTPFMQGVAVNASVNTLAAISVDRSSTLISIFQQAANEKTPSDH
jgi:7 transmembrane receptor (rhodopsin family)